MAASAESAVGVAKGALSLAVIMSNMAEVQRLVAEGADVNEQVWCDDVGEMFGVWNVGLISFVR